MGDDPKKKFDSGFVINKELFEIILNKDVESYKIGTGSNAGDNFMSTIHGIEVTLKDSKVPHHVLIKCYPNHTGRRDFLDQSDVFGKEFFFYTVLATKFQEMIMEAGKEKELYFAIPEYLCGNYKRPSLQSIQFPEPWDQENFIAMTDLRKSEGYKMASRIEGIDFDHCSLALKELSTYHALSWCYKVKNKIEKLSTVYSHLLDTMFSSNFETQFKPLLDSVNQSCLTFLEDTLGKESLITSGTKKFLSLDQASLLQSFVSSDGIDDSYPESFLRLPSKSSTVDLKDPWMLVCQGDYWVNNMLFLYDPVTNKPIKMIMLDHQVCREGCPTTDLAYFFYSSTTSATRRPHEDTLLKLYYDQFIHVCNQLDCEPLPGFSFENLKIRFRRAKLFGFSMSIPILSIVLRPAEEAIDLEVVEGDFGDVMASAMGGRETNTRLRDRLVEIVTELYEDGIF